MSEKTAFRGVRALGEGYRAGEFTPLDVAEAALARLDRLEPALNAFADRMRDQVLADAALRSRQLRSGEDFGPLHGVLVAIKDLIDVEGVPTGYGSRVRKPVPAKADAELVGRLRRAGAVLFGKTNLLEYAYGVAHPDVGQTNNPHDPGRTSGGSSGGSAAAVAAGIVPLAIGTDTGGTIRIPAAYCGIVGLKPSFGLVPTDGVFPLSWSLDHAGPLARAVEDAVLALACLAETPMTIDAPPLSGLRLGVIRDHLDAPVVTPDVAGCVRKSLGLLEARGARLIDFAIPDLARANRELVKVLLPEAALVHRELYTENAAGYAAGTRSQIEAGFAAKAVDYLLAQRYRAALGAVVEASFAEVDVLVSPSVPFVAPAEDPEFIEDADDGEILASGLANMTGHPSLSLPCGMSEGLPVGLQLTGRLGQDARLLSVARTVEGALHAYRPPVDRP
ncbi:amidase [Consotaella aegiceratis]|uniref:amidase n=1 Tax=Consotaella aegiceratis TaxID=3097961 RepID=UPI002F40B029